MQTAAKRFSGKRIVMLRNRAGITQADLARRTHLHVGQLSRIEREKTPNPGAQILGPLAAALGCSIEDFYVTGDGAGDDEDDEETELFAAAHRLDVAGEYELANRLRARARQAARKRPPS